MAETLALVRRSARGSAVLAASLAATLVVAYLAADPSQLRTAVTIGAVLLMAAIGLAWPQHLLYTLVAWLVALGFLRRVLTLAAPPTGPDPLLLVEPAAIALLLVVISRRVPMPRSALSTAVAVTTGVIALSALNPSQGSITVGVAGLLFLVVPTMGFWIGRSFLTDAVFARMLKLLGALAVPVALYGLYQTFVGFPRWDTRWILDVAQGYQALNVGAAVRPFASLPSSAEYAYVVAIGIAIWLAFGLRVLRVPATIAATSILGTALVLASSRLVVFLSAAALIAMAASRLRVRASVAAVVVLLSFVGTSAVVGKIAPDYHQAGVEGSLLSHQVQGIANPLESKSSTFFIHLSLVTQGLSSAIAHPAGLGAGTVSLAAGRFGGVAKQSEADPSNLAIAAGIPGLACYLVLAVLAFVRAYTLARARRDALALAALAIVTIVFLQWFNGGQYGIALVLWLTLGWIDRTAASKEAPA